MYLTQTNVIRSLTKDEYLQLSEMCFFSNCLYNVAIYNIRQQYFNDKTYLTYPKNEPFCKENENYRLMQSNCAQQTLRVAAQAFKSFFGLLKLATEGKYDYKKISEVKIIPKYNGRYFKIAYCYEVEVEDLQLNQNNSLAIDIGFDNLATCVTNTGTSFIMDGRKIKSINQYWNKQKAKLQSIFSK